MNRSASWSVTVEKNPEIVRRAWPPLLSLLIVTLALSTFQAEAAPALTEDQVDWPAFLARQDPVWEELPTQWNEGAFAGNGNMGFVVYANLRENRLVFHLGRADVTDHRKAPDRKTSLGVPGADVFFDFPRLDVGRISLVPSGKILGGTLRQDLWNAEITGVLKTDCGEIRWRAMTIRDQMIHLMEVSSTETSASGKPAKWDWVWTPGNPASPRALARPEAAKENGYRPNPSPRGERLDGVPVCIQPLEAGGDFATAWLEDRQTIDRSSVLFVSTANEIPASGKSAPKAVADVNAARKTGISELLSAHRDWWHSFYRRSFLTVPDPRLESFFWIQMYKLACCLRSDGPALDVLGPFYRTTAWPGLWWNLNIQLSYWPVYAGNHLDLGKSLTCLIDARFPELLAKFENSTSLGDLAWVLHNYWWQLRFAGGWKEIQERWKPKAKAVLAAYQKKLSPDTKGQLRLGPLGSPEYRGFSPFLHTSYNLALLRWLLTALGEADRNSGTTPDADAAEWSSLLEQLAPFSVDDTGIRIADNQGLDISHRHFSHLLAIYPLFQLDPERSEDRKLAETSLQHWHRIEGGKALAGYSFTGGAALYAALGMGTPALGMLQNFLDGKSPASRLHSNTFYTESGGKNPVIETPLSAASATMDLLLQSWGRKIRIFPAVPEEWKEATFRDLRAEGGFLVSAARHNGQTAWVRIQSEAGEPCILKVPDWGKPIDWLREDGNCEPLKPDSSGDYQIPVKKGQTAILFPHLHSNLVRICPVTRASDSTHPYGLKKGQGSKSDPSYVEPAVPWSLDWN